MRMRRKPNLEPRMERCSHLLIRQPEALRGKWRKTFNYDSIHLELGCGKGCFIAKTAQNSPDVLFVALEISANVIVSALELAVKENLKNVRFINAPAEKLREFFAPAEVSRIYINFCDPWPSNRHRKRRLVGINFLRLYKDILCSGGELEFKTDNSPLFEFALREIESGGYTLAECLKDVHKNGPIGIMTEYEQRFAERGLPIFRCRIGFGDSLHEAD